MGEAFNNGPLGDIMKKYNLVWTQVTRQLKNYKNKKYQHTQINIIMGSSDLTQIMHDGLSMSLLEFVSQMLKRICNPANPSRTSRTDKIHGPGQTPVSRDGLR